jgi:ferrochelatase
MRDDGVLRAYAFVTSANSSWSGCRQYREDVARAQAEVGEGAPQVAKLRHYYNHPAFIECFADATLAALQRLPEPARAGARVAFTAHSVPRWMADSAGPGGGAYAAQLAETASLVMQRVGRQRAWELVYQSRSGPPSQPWLEPDVLDHVEAQAAAGVPGLVLVPIGFVSDHMEVRYDLDTEAAGRAAELGLPLARAGTPGADPRFVAMVGDLLAERRGRTRERAALGVPSHDRCPVACCAAPAR